MASITALPTVPTILDSSTFAARADALVTALAQLQTDVNVIANAGITITSPKVGNTASITSGVATTITASSLRFVEIVYAYVANSGVLEFAVLISDSVNTRIAQTGGGSNVTITLSGNNIQVTQTLGAPNVVNWKILSF